ncbi:MAG: SRPBCC family protein [Gemmatimonadaceae bacterium]|nr:SRPBCC family protein [Gemmatimonadaceae bacterium]
MPTPTAQPARADEIRITRIYDAPLAAVWAAWTDPAQVAQWWGPRGFSITTSVRDLRPGGSWAYVMHGPDGTDWPNFTRYHEVEPQARLVYDHGASSADTAPMFRMTVTFRDLDGRTELDIRMGLPTPEDAQRTRGFIKSAGGNGTWDRLGEFVEKQVHGRDIFIINRTVDAPIETVFDMWTMPEQIRTWLPPSGFTMTFQRADILSGGTAAFAMTNGAFTMWARHDYVQVRRPDLLQYAQTFTDERGTVVRQPGAPTWPETTLVTVTFVGEDSATTRVTVRFDVQPSATADEIETFVAERGGMAQGWTGSFDALDTVLGAAG